MPPLCKGRGTACGGGIVGWARPIGKRRFFSFAIPQSAPLTAPFTQGSQTGETTSGREPFPVLQARRWPVTWRAGSRFCFVYALIFACGGFDPPCSRFSGKTPKQKAGPFLPDRLLYLVCFESADSPFIPFQKVFCFLFFRKGSLLPSFLQKRRFSSEKEVPSFFIPRPCAGSSG